MHYACIGSVACAACLVAGKVAAAPVVEPAHVQLVLPKCAALSFDAPSFETLVGVELAQMGAHTATAAATHPVATLRVDQQICSQDATQVTVTVVDALTQKVSARSIELAASTPSARARVLAIASAELLRASWLELSAERARAVVEGVVRLGVTSFEVRQTVVRAPLASAAVPSAPVHDVAPLSQWHVAALADTRLFITERGGLFGASVNVGRAAKNHSVDVSAKYNQGELPDALGRISLGMVSLNARVARRWVGEQSSWSFGPTLEAGYAWCSALASPGAVAGADGHAPILLVGAAAEFEGHVAGDLAGRMRVELGQTVLGLDANSNARRAAAIHGAYMGLSAGLSFGL